MNDSRHPTLCVYSVISRQDSGEDWLSIGQAVPHRDGQGFDVILQALPLNPKLVLRDHAPVDQQTPDRHCESRRLRSLKQQVDAFERAIIEHCLLESGGKIGAVIERLDIPRRTLSEKIARLGIDRFRLINGPRASSLPRNAQSPAPSDVNHHDDSNDEQLTHLSTTSQPTLIESMSRPFRRSESR
jgi:hypothetical protein